MENKFIQQMKKGVLDMIVLNIIRKKHTYGYELIQKLEREGEGFFDLKEGTCIFHLSSALFPGIQST